MRGLVLILALVPWQALAGDVSPWLLHPPKGLAPELQKPVVRVHATMIEAPGPSTRAALVRAGARLVELPGGGIAAVGRVISLDVPREKLLGVARVRGVVRLDPGIPLMRRSTLDRTTQLVGAPRVWSSVVPMDPARVGSGVVVADHEQGWDPFHPDMFFPDGGLFDWTDDDGDGRLSTGDGIVVDGTRRRLSILESGIDDVYLSTRVDTGPELQPGIDWVYVDLNRNGSRDFGRGFGRAPALGEPIFAADDVNGNEVLEVGEKLVRLGTPKVRAISDNGALFTRGQNLEDYVVSPVEASHGLGATGILAAGWPELRRFTGVAPGVELVLVKSDDTVEGLAVAQRLGARLHYWEFDSLVEIHDGSSAIETALSDDASGTGVHLTASGNITGTGHNLLTNLQRGQPTTLPFDTVPAGFPEPAVIIMSITWIGDPAELDIDLMIDGNVAGVFGHEPMSQLSARGMDFQVIRDRSPRGTAAVQMSITGGASIPLHRIELVVTSRMRDIRELRGLLVDDVSGWGPGAFWTAFNTNVGTALVPSTADRVIAVGAYGGVHDLSMFGWGRPGEVRAYSGTGPRIDGSRVIDVIGPDDPFAPSLFGRYESFGGTSGALPHATGVAALFIAANPGATHRVVEQALTDNAIADRFTGMRPNDEAGFGKVSASQVLLGVHSEAGIPPTVTLRADGMFLPNRPIRVTADARDSDGRVVRVDWDEGYDRVYEGSTTGPHVRALTLDAAGRLQVVARAIDDDGQSSRVLLTIDGVAQCSPATCNGCCQPDQTCGPCPNDGGVVRPDRPLNPDARPARDARPADAADGGGGRPGDAEDVDDIGGPSPRRMLETLPEAEASCGCTSAAGGGGDLVIALLALLVLRKRDRFSL